MMPVSRNHYDTHFYCALCGGPFAQVFRTPVTPATSKCTSVTESQGSKDPADTDPQCEFNFNGEENRVLPEEVVEHDIGYEARRSRERRLRAEEEGQRRGVMSERRTVRQAYDGKRISVKQMKWTKNLRALIHSNARNKPLNSDIYTDIGEEAFLTGRGLIRQSYNWADAFASDQEDEDAASEYPVFQESADGRNLYGFHLYQELSGDNAKSFISSIPFHSQCWSLFGLAIEATGYEKNLECDVDDFEGQIWDCLQGFIDISGEKRQADQTHTNLHNGTRKEVVRRFSAIDYREAQGSGEGWHWRHEDGCHWLAADPSHIPEGSLLKLGPNNDPLPRAPRDAIVDPFTKLPNEVILMISAYLSSSDIFSWKTASPTVLHVGLPESYYRRFLRQEFLYLHPQLTKEIDQNEKMGIESPVDWRGSFERLRRLARTPRLSGHPEDENYGKEWDEIDIGLKNRRRIWKIVKPIAETLVETSDLAMQYVFHAPENAVGRTGVARGYIGTRAGSEGTVCTAYVGCRALRVDSYDDDEEEVEEEIINVRVDALRMCYDGSTGILTGIEFETFEEELDKQNKTMFGRRGTEHHYVSLWGKFLAGFVFSFAQGIVCGAQALFMDTEEARARESVELQFSKRVGRWGADAFIRKVIAPPEHRKFVGLTGFLNSAGFIETVAILEETHAVELDHIGPQFEPPRTIPMTHNEASLWRKKLPPRNVALREREGIATTDWRIAGSEWEIWAPGYHEDGVEIRDFMPSVGRLEKITGYYDQRFLRGLEFIYVNLNGHRTSSLIGVKESEKQSSFIFSNGENVIASVISSSDEGVHGILFVTQRGRTSPMLGPRFLGTQKVFAPPPELRNGGTEHREDLTCNIIGLHALYDYQDKRFLQLGIACEIEEAVSVQSIFSQPLPCPIPFDIKDETLGVWVEKPLPKDWIIGSSPSEVRIDTSYRTRRRKPFNDYSGWASLESLSRITIYRDMTGIKFSYAGGEERFFGYVDDEVDASVQEIAHQKGEKVIGVAVLDCATCHPLELVVDEDDDKSILSASSRPQDGHVAMEWLHFITNFNQEESSSSVKCKTRFPEHLVAVKFNFNHDRLVSWAPVYAWKPGGLSQRELVKRIKFPWRAHDQDIVEDSDIPETAHTISTLFGDNDAGRIDGVKGYVTRKGKFCGLLFRRNERWSEGVFGERSAYETPFFLEPDECFTSIFLPEKGGKRESNALALLTNHGRVTPWFGKIEEGSVARHLDAPPDHVAVGLYGAQFNKPNSYGRYELDRIGLLYRPKLPSTSAVPSHLGTPPLSWRDSTPLPRKGSYHVPDEVTGLEWICLQSWNSGIKLTSLISSCGYGTVPGQLGRAFSMFEPDKLLQISVWSCQGICSLRFLGTGAMGLITVGDWPADAEGVKLSGDKKMSIDGPRGERLCNLKVVFEGPGCSGRIIGLRFKTSFGRTKTFSSPLMGRNESLELRGDNVTELGCGEDCEIVGLHGVFDTHEIYDLGLVGRSTHRV